MKAIVGLKLEDCDQPLVPDKNFKTGREAFQKKFGDITSLEEDLLRVSAGIFVTDLAFKREPREDHIRDINLTIPVVNFHALQNAKEEIEEVLFILSTDNWSIDFTQLKGTPETPRDWPQKKSGTTLLFSGGLDSYCYASTVLKKKEPLMLVSHVTHNKVVESSQNSLKVGLDKIAGYKIDRFPCRVFARSISGYPFPKDHDREESQRTRSFLFLAIACLIARRVGFLKVVTIAENGQFAIHLPLTAARVGPFSTHTAHPEFVSKMQSLMKKILNASKLNIANPFLYKTKAEVISSIDNTYQTLFPLSVSCWRGSRVQSNNHCGECVPCIARRIAFEANGIKYNEYHRNLFSEKIEDKSEDDIGKRNLIDLIEFIKHFHTLSPTNKDEFIDIFPELVNPYVDLGQAIKMYTRFAKEAFLVFKKYQNLKAIVN